VIAVPRFEAYPSLDEDVWRACRDQIKARAQLVRDTAKNIAPVDTGEYRRPISMTVRPIGRGWRIQADATYSKFLEFGTRYMRAHRTLLIASRVAKRGQ